MRQLKSQINSKED